MLIFSGFFTFGFFLILIWKFIKYFNKSLEKYESFFNYILIIYIVNASLLIFLILFGITANALIIIILIIFYYDE